MDKKVLSKLKQYIEEERPQKLKSYVKKNKIDLRHVMLKKKRNLLHICCKHGSGTILRYLLLSGVDSQHQDDGGQSPLHVALNVAMKLQTKSDADKVTELYNEVIIPLLEGSPACLDIRDKDGISCRRLLQDLVRQREAANPEENHQEQSAPPEPGDLNDREWRDKLAEEFNNEFYDTYGKYEADPAWDSREEETCGDWADRIREEYRAKKRAQERARYSRASSGEPAHTGTKGEKKKRSTKWDKSSEKYDDETLRNARERMKRDFDKSKARDLVMDVLKTRIKYEERYQTVMTSQNVGLCFNDIPWPSKKGEHMDLSVLFDGMDKTGAEYKKYLRDQQIRWHPDKFLQRFGHHIDSKEKARIMQRVTNISQSLNKLKT